MSGETVDGGPEGELGVPVGDRQLRPGGGVDRRGDSEKELIFEALALVDDIPATIYHAERCGLTNELTGILRRLLLKASARQNRAALDGLHDGHRADQVFENFDPGYDWRDDAWSRRHKFTGEEVTHVDQPPSA